MEQQYLTVLEGDRIPGLVDYGDLSPSQIVRIIEMYNITPERLEALTNYTSQTGLGGWTDNFKSKALGFLQGGWDNLTGKTQIKDQQNQIEQMQLQMQLKEQEKSNKMLMVGGGAALVIVMLMMRRKAA